MEDLEDKGHGGGSNSNMRAYQYLYNSMSSSNIETPPRRMRLQDPGFSVYVLPFLAVRRRAL
jgi:hypothetical protein